MGPRSGAPCGLTCFQGGVGCCPKKKIEAGRQSQWRDLRAGYHGGFPPTQPTLPTQCLVPEGTLNALGCGTGSQKGSPQSGRDRCPWGSSPLNVEEQAAWERLRGQSVGRKTSRVLPWVWAVRFRSCHHHVSAVQCGAGRSPSPSGLGTAFVTRG